MKKLLIPIFMILFSTLVITVIPTEADAAIYEDTVRLHILAPSDSSEDQALKLAVRDRLLEKYSTELSLSSSVDDAKARIAVYLPSIEADCNEWIRELGYSYTAKASLTDEWYDTRVYESFTLPSGTYASLKIEIGEAEGANWWCVMYPPMCLDIATTDARAEYSEEEYRLISPSGYNVKFKLLEVVSRIGKSRR